jgi:hypothetical protein
MDHTNLMLGTFTFRFNTTLPVLTPDLPEVYTVNFGELTNGSLAPKGDMKEAWDSVGGVLALIKAVQTKRKVEFSGDLNKLDPTTVLPYYFGSASGSGPAFGKVSEGYGYLAIQAEGEPIVPAPAANKGDAILRWYAFPCGLYIDGELKQNGEDFGMLKLHVIPYLGRGVGTWKAAARPVAPAP